MIELIIGDMYFWKPSAKKYTFVLSQNPALSVQDFVRYLYIRHPDFRTIKQNGVSKDTMVFLEQQIPEQLHEKLELKDRVSIETTLKRGGVKDNFILLDHAMILDHSLSRISVVQVYYLNDQTRNIISLYDGPYGEHHMAPFPPVKFTLR